MNKIVVGADPLGNSLKQKIVNHLEEKGFEIIDVGSSVDCDVDYDEVGNRVGKLISNGEFERGIIFCGTGMGVNIVANKHPNVYCGLCESVSTARLCRTINNCNVLSLGALIVSEYNAIEMVDTFLNTEFTKNFDLADPAFLKLAYERIKTIEENVFKV